MSHQLLAFELSAMGIASNYPLASGSSSQLIIIIPSHYYSSKKTDAHLIYFPYFRA